MIALRIPVTEMITKITPEINTAHNAAVQLNPIAPQIVYENKALTPIPAARATG